MTLAYQDVYPDEGHWFSKRDNQIKARTAAGEFLLARLAPTALLRLEQQP